MPTTELDFVFVFGSNRAGIHGAGAASYAVKHRGAVLMEGEGHFGNSYALPSKNEDIESLPLVEVQNHVDTFINYAAANPHLKFQVTQIGCGLAGFQMADIAPLFRNAPDNCYFDSAWESILGENKRYWGTF